MANIHDSGIANVHRFRDRVAISVGDGGSGIPGRTRGTAMIIRLILRLFPHSANLRHLNLWWHNG